MLSVKMHRLVRFFKLQKEELEEQLPLSLVISPEFFLTDTFAEGHS